MRPYLRLTRAHTVPLEAIPAALGAVLATGELFTPAVAMWFIAGAMYHLSGYGMNSLTDWESGHDKNDPNKQHHPLNTGEITHHQAKVCVFSLFVATAIYVGILAQPRVSALILMVIGVVSGVAYNILGKRTIFKPVPISIAHTTTFAIPYLALGGEIADTTFLLLASFMFLWVLFQIGVSGEVKDILEIDEANILRDTKMMEVKEDWLNSAKVYPDVTLFIVSATLNIAMVLFGLFATATMVMLESHTKFALIYSAVGLAVLVLSEQVIVAGDYVRDKRVRMMSLKEMATLFCFTLSFYPIIGWSGAITLITLSVVWVLAFNRIEWGTWLAPEV